jgi:CO/xanthine dehydrogenase FAD-binding subunit
MMTRSLLFYQTQDTTQIRNRATLVGNLSNASPAADTATPLLVYGAIVNIVGSGGTRRVALQDFLEGVTPS